MDTSASSPTAPASRRLLTSWQLALACFLNMCSVGTMYALSVVQAELPRLLGVSHGQSFLPFLAASLGLAVGVATAARQMHGSSGPCATASRGSILWGLAVLSTGHFLSSLNFPLILASLTAGGVGVGWTYLAIVLLVGQALPHHALARSAIGPLGFSTGTAACLAASKMIGFSSLDPQQLGSHIQYAGITFVAVGAGTMVLSSSSSSPDQNRDQSQDQTSSKQSTVIVFKGRPYFSTLIFFNALPGMMAFSSLIPAARHHTLGRDTMPSAVTCSMAALAVGGILSSPLMSRLGARLSFSLLFCLRGSLLLTSGWTGSPALAVVSLAAVLFGHGAGFSALPGLIKAQLGQPAAQFPTAYGQILVSWGVAGVVASALNSILVGPSGDVGHSSLVLGMILFPASAVMYMYSQGK